jgi:acetyltransferase-like isoleucine patch superfamily enzyme
VTDASETPRATAAEVLTWLRAEGHLLETFTAEGADLSALELRGIQTDASAGAGDVAWSRRSGGAEHFGGALLLCDPEGLGDARPRAGRVIAVCANPRLAMARVVERFFAHLTADREPEFAEPRLAAVAATLGAWIMNARIGHNVTLGPQCTIGCSGMGYERDQAGRLVKFPQTGLVVIEDDVDVAAQAMIQRAAIGATVIRRGAKIGPHVNVGHNVDVGEDVLIAGHAQIGGGARIGRGAVVWQSAAIANGVTVGEGAVVGMSAAVRRDIEPGEVWAGNPARKLR